MRQHYNPSLKYSLLGEEANPLKEEPPVHIPSSRFPQHNWVQKCPRSYQIS
jgi:hypothetical protein